MLTLIFATLLQASTAAHGADTYADAQRQAENGKPLVVLVSTDWCPPCREMKKNVLPEVRKRGLFRNIAFTIVNPDHDRKLARKLTGGDAAIPQLIMYRKTIKGWKRRRLVGRRSVAAVEQFIKEGVALNEADSKHPGQPAKGPQQPRPAGTPTERVKVCSTSDR